MSVPSAPLTNGRLHLKQFVSYADLWWVDSLPDRFAGHLAALLESFYAIQRDASETASSSFMQRGTRTLDECVAVSMRLEATSRKLTTATQEHHDNLVYVRQSRVQSMRASPEDTLISFDKFDTALGDMDANFSALTHAQEILFETVRLGLTTLGAEYVGAVAA